jgi:hypothetical protein
MDMQKITVHSILKKILLTCFIACSLKAYSIDKKGNIKGIVFEDANGNMELDPGEKGIPGVLVSNQFDVVSTDSSGNYILDVEDDHYAVFVIKPPGYLCPLNKDNLPLYYKIGLYDGRGPAIINFPLVRTAEKDTFSVVIFADPQPRDSEELNYIRDDVVAELSGTDALFGITLGDIMFDDLSHFGRYNDIISKTAIPFYNVPGNHDADYDSISGTHSYTTFRKVYGPDYYAFEYVKVNFIVLNTVHWVDDPKIVYHRNYEGRVGEVQLRWLKNYLQFVPSDELIVLCMHIPFYSYSSDLRNDNVADRQVLFNLLKGRKHILALTGHLHALENNYLDKTGGWTYKIPFHQVSCAAVCGSWWRGPKDERGIPAAVQLNDGTPNGYHIFKFEGNDYSQRYKCAGMDENYQIRISAPRGIISRKLASEQKIAVNFFNGNDSSDVVCQVDNDEPVRMTMTTMIDPFAAHLLHDYPDLYDEWIECGLTRHMWITDLPNGLGTGVHKIEVSATDEYGNSYNESALFEIF